jgi:hypothetical protein
MESIPFDLFAISLSTYTLWYSLQTVNAILLTVIYHVESSVPRSALIRITSSQHIHRPDVSPLVGNSFGCPHPSAYPPPRQKED